jgi:ribose/xylose/arabinose/galactoside ABC-type transport system permease subunit
VICNILTDNAFLGIIAVGMTFVILSGGIDLSVGSVIARRVPRESDRLLGISPLVAFPLVLVMGCAFGAFMGLLDRRAENPGVYHYPRRDVLPARRELSGVGRVDSD